MVVLIILGHERHNLATLGHCSVELKVCRARHRLQLFFLLLELSLLASLNKSHVVHLVVEVIDSGLGIVDLGKRLPIHHDSHQVLSSLLQPVLEHTLENVLLVLVGAVPLLPLLEGAGCTLEVGASKSVGHALLTHLVQVCLGYGKFTALISLFLGKNTK